jgi:methylenetetrahydrofolate reductase (NADPH)
MRVSQMWQAGGKPTVSFELFPPRNEIAAGKLVGIIDKLEAVGPDFISVTFGAGGSTRQGSYDLARSLIQDRKLEVMTYLSCYGMDPVEIKSVLDSYRDLGVDNLLAVRGDAPRDDNFKPHPDSLPHATDLVTLIKPDYEFEVGAAAYPEGHAEADSLDTDIEYLKLKVASGATYLIANYFWDNEFFFDLERRCRAAGISVPILPGIMPVYSAKIMHNLSKLSGASIPDHLSAGIAALPPDDKKAAGDFCLSFALDQCRGLLNHGVPGIHIYTMDRAKVPVAMVETLRTEGLL